MDRPPLRALVAVLEKDGWAGQMAYVSLRDAVAFRQENPGFVILVDVDDEITLTAWLRERLPWNQARLKRWTDQ